jgi:hypothetical protein
LKDIADKEKQMKNDVSNDWIKKAKAYDDLKNEVVSKKELKKVVESDSSYTESESESECERDDEQPPPKSKKQVGYFGTKNPK